MESETQRNMQFFQILYRKRKQIIVFVIIATIAALVFSSPTFITPLYSSEVILYPPSTNSNRMLVDRDVRFGSDKEIDEQIQLLKSNIVRDSVIKKFNLYTHYDIDSTRSDKKYRMNEEYDDRITIDRTRYNSIAVSVLDENPVMAASIADYIVKTGDNLKSAIIHDKLKEAFDQLAESIFGLSMDIDQLAEKINESFHKQVVTGSGFYKKNGIDQLKEQLDLKGLMQVARSTSNTQELEQLYYYESKLQQLSTLQLSYDQALVSMNNQIPSSFVVSPAEVADKKTFPIRWLIILVAGLASILIGSAIALIAEKSTGFLQRIRS